MKHTLLAPLLAALCAVAPASAQVGTAQFQFCWVGANGYTMEGQIAFPQEFLNTGIITQTDVTKFQIIGFLDGVAIGSWDMRDLTPETSWLLRFDTDTLSFPTGGIRSENTYQEWNADGRVDNCGAVEGFGWNGGNFAQDVCVNNTWVEDSSIDPNTPLFAQPIGVALNCETTVPVS